MKRLLYIVITLMLSVPIMAQVSIGFENPSMDMSDVKAFAAWQYVNAWVDCFRDDSATEAQKQEVEAFDKFAEQIRLSDMTLLNADSYNRYADSLTSIKWSGAYSIYRKVYDCNDVNLFYDEAVGAHPKAEKYPAKAKSAMDKIKKELDSQYKKNVIPVSESTAAGSLETSVSDTNTGFDVFFWLPWMLVVIEFVALIVFVVLFVNSRRYCKEQEKQWNRRKRELKNMVDSANNKIHDLTMQLKSNMVKSEVQATRATLSPIAEVRSTPEIPQKKLEVLYLWPFALGVFKEGSQSESYFKLTKNGESYGLFEFCGDAEYAIANRDEVFDGFCSIIEIRGNKSVKTEKPGRAEFRNGVWCVTEKAMIKFGN